MKRARGFTLIEVVVATVIGIILLGTITGIMLTAIKDSKRARVISGFQRDLASVGQLFNSELRQAGLGVPFDSNPAATNPPQGEHIQDSYGGAGITAFYAPVIVGAVSQVGIIGDLPRDDANYPTFGPLHSRPLTIAARDAIAWHTENNGTCWPDATVDTCNIADTSIFFPGEGNPGCATGAERNCPWGLRRAGTGEALLIADGAGRWGTVRFAGGTLVSRLTDPVRTLAPPYAVPMGSLSTGWPLLWPSLCSRSLPLSGATNCLAGETPSAPDGTPLLLLIGNPGEIPGGGFVSTPDRVFFRLSGTAGTTATCAAGAPNFCNVERIRCWGDPDPNNASFPPATATVMPATLTYTGSNCGNVEIVARNVANLTFTYTNATEGSIAAPIATAANKKAVRRINYRMEFRKLVEGRTVSFTGSGSVRLQNL